MENLFNKLDIPQLNEFDTALYDKPLTIEECTKALKLKKNNKSPGSDGFSTNFYILLR